MADGATPMEMAGEDGSVANLTQLIANLQNQMDVSARMTSVKQLGTIAVALGPERTRDELLPFLIGCIDEDDEVADAICDELIKFGPLVGGQAYVRLPLASHPNPSVRVRRLLPASLLN